MLSPSQEGIRPGLSPPRWARGGIPHLTYPSPTWVDSSPSIAGQDDISPFSQEEEDWDRQEEHLFISGAGYARAPAAKRPPAHPATLARTGVDAIRQPGGGPVTGVDV